MVLPCYLLAVEPDASPSQPSVSSQQDVTVTALSTTDVKEDNKCVIDEEGDT